MQVTARDEAMLEWLGVVRLADMESLRWALGGLSGVGVPVSLRKAQQWVARCREVGLVGSARPSFRDGSVVWATYQASGRSAPNLYRQTVRHDVAVAAVAARYLCHGWSWESDREPVNRSVDHVADGVARRGDDVELVEVELTPKTLSRYVKIFNSHLHRMAHESVGRVVYFCEPMTERAMQREADTRVFRTDRHRVVTVEAFDVRGRWVADDAALWVDGRVMDLSRSVAPASDDGLAFSGGLGR